MSEVLLLTGGRGHPPDASAASLKECFGDLGIGVDATEDVEAGLARLDPGRHVLLAVNALRFTMTDPRYDDVRSDHAFSLSVAGRAAIAAWHDAGRPILSIHAGVICFDDWPGWGDLLGARWDWNRSSHPPLATFEVCAGDDTFEVFDECYQGLDIDPAVDIVATSGDRHPLAWVREHGGAKVAVDLLGHDARSLDHLGHRRLLTSLVQRLLEFRP